MLHFYCTTAVGMGLIPGQGTKSPYDKQHRGEKKGGGHVVKVLERIYRLLLLPSVSNTSAVLCLVAQSCPTLCDPMDCSLPGSSVHGDSPSKNTEVCCHFLLPSIFPTQGSNLSLLHCQADSLPAELPGVLFWSLKIQKQVIRIFAS